MFLYRSMLFFVMFMVLTATCAATNPPDWISQGTNITYTAALSNYYSLYDTAPEKWEQFEGTGGYGYWVNSVLSSDKYEYKSQSTVYDHFSSNIRVAFPWTYQPEDEVMGLFWVDTDQEFFTPQNLLQKGLLSTPG